MEQKENSQDTLNPVSVGLLIGTSLVLMLLLIICVGCVSKKITLHPLEKDFQKMDGGWFMSDFYLCEVMGVHVEGLNCDEVKTK